VLLDRHLGSSITATVVIRILPELGVFCEERGIRKDKRDSIAPLTDVRLIKEYMELITINTENSTGYVFVLE